MTKEQQIKNYITNRFNNMTYDEYEDMCCGTGTLSVLDEAISEYDADCELNDDEVAKLAEYCDNESDAFYNKHVDVLGYRLMTKQVLTDITDMSSLIHDVLIDIDNIGRLKAYVDLYTECANKLIDDHYVERQNIKDTLQRLVRTLQDTRELTDDDMSDLFNDYLNKFDEKCQRALDNYRRYYDYNNTDHFIDMLNEATFADFDRLEMQLIATIYYSTVNDDRIIGYKCFKLNRETGEITDETDYYSLTKEQTINEFSLEVDCDVSDILMYPIKNK